MEKINIGKVCPIPRGEWNINNTYEKLNLVNKDGETYIAKENVPASIEIENTRYWMKITEKYNLSIGEINTVSSSTQADASFSFDENNNEYKLNLNIPKGENGVIEKEIKILFIGNSLTLDGISYLPYLLSTYYPEINFKFYDWFIGGSTLQTHYNAFINNLFPDTFSVAETGDLNWNIWHGSSINKTMEQILSEYQFDIVCIQPYFKDTESLDLEMLQNCINYIISHYKTNNINKNGLEFITLAHAPLRNNRSTVYNRTITAIKTMLKNTIIDDLLPTGIAINMACDSDLNSLGDRGELTPDGTHAQEGLPSLMQAYVILCWIFNKLGIPKSIYGHPMTMTSELFNSLRYYTPLPPDPVRGIPGPNLGTGVVEGTREQNLLAQEIAIKAFKEGKTLVNKYSSYYFGFTASYSNESLIITEDFNENSNKVSYNSSNNGLIFIK